MPSSQPLNGDLPFEHVAVHRRAVKRLSLRIKADGSVEMVGPKRLALAEFRQFYQSKQGWIADQQRKIAAARAQQPSLTEHQLMLFGQPLARRDGPAIVVNHSGDTAAIFGPAELSKEQLYKRFAVLYLAKRLPQLAQQTGLTYQRLSVRSQRTRWGSCSANGNISLNWRLVQMPPAVSDYVMIHELCHTKHMNHSAEFWQLVKQHCAELEPCRSWLKRHGAHLPD